VCEIREGHGVSEELCSGGERRSLGGMGEPYSFHMAGMDPPRAVSHVLVKAPASGVPDQRKPCQSSGIPICWLQSDIDRNWHFTAPYNTNQNQTRAMMSSPAKGVRGGVMMLVAGLVAGSSAERIVASLNQGWYGYPQPPLLC
jgi:hypothetical protein